MANFIQIPFATNGDKTTIPIPLQLDGSVSYTAGFTSDYQQNPNTLVVCDVTGIPGFVIPAGSSIVVNADGYSFMLLTPITLNGLGNGSGLFQSIISGFITSPAGTITQILNPLPGWSTVTNPADAYINANAKLVPRYQTNQVLYDVSSVAHQYQIDGVPDFITPDQYNGNLYPYDKYSKVRFTEQRHVTSAIINNPGTGYSSGDILTIVGGTGIAAELIVLSESLGLITSIFVYIGGNYTVSPPIISCPVTGGTGTGATFDLTTFKPITISPGLYYSLVDGNSTLPYESSVWASFTNSIEPKYYNYIINGGMDINQRNSYNQITLTGNSSGFVADRWFFSQTAGTTILNTSNFGIGVSTLPVENLRSFLHIHRTVTGSVTNLITKLEDVSSFGGFPISIVFQIPKTLIDPLSTLTIKFTQNFGTGTGPYGPPSSPVSGTINIFNLALENSYTPYQYLFNMPSIIGKTLGINLDSYTEFNFEFSDTLFDILFTNVSIVRSPYYHSFTRRTLTEELSLCQRYYQTSYPLGIAPGTPTVGNGYIENFNNAINVNDTLYEFNTRFKTRMAQLEPTINFYSPVSGAIGNVFNTGTSLDVPILSTFNAVSDSQTGSPQVTVSQAINTLFTAHWTAEAEI